VFNAAPDRFSSMSRRPRCGDSLTTEPFLTARGVMCGVLRALYKRFIAIVTFSALPAGECRAVEPDGGQ
jgi:hypothetical protein